LWCRRLLAEKMCVWDEKESGKKWEAGLFVGAYD
jgi:hypothetical protein